MVKSIIKNILLVGALLIWYVALYFLVGINNEVWRTICIVIMSILSYLFLRMYNYIEIYQNFKKLYFLMKDANKKRRINMFEGNVEKFLDYTEWIESTGDDMLETSELLTKNCPWLPKKKLIWMTNDVERMMKNKYPPV